MEQEEKYKLLFEYFYFPIYYYLDDKNRLISNGTFTVSYLAVLSQN